MLLTSPHAQSTKHAHMHTRTHTHTHTHTHTPPTPPTRNSQRFARREPPIQCSTCVLIVVCWLLSLLHRSCSNSCRQTHPIPHSLVQHPSSVYHKPTRYALTETHKQTNKQRQTHTQTHRQTNREREKTHERNYGISSNLAVLALQLRNTHSGKRNESSW